MCDKNLVPATDVIEIRQLRLTREELIRQLREYGCPESVMEQVIAWHIDYLLDTNKLERWNKNAEVNK